MTMYKNINDIFNVFYNDETLQRLLYYHPQNHIKGTPDPLDSSLDNILDIDEYGEIRNERILLIPQISDLEEKKICRIYLYAGKRKPVDNGYLYSNQEVIIDILCHNDYEKDLRSLRISDRVNELLIGNRITGFGKVNYINGKPISAPLNYVAYSHVFEIGSMKK